MTAIRESTISAYVSTETPERPTCLCNEPVVPQYDDGDKRWYKIPRDGIQLEQPQIINLCTKRQKLEHVMTAQTVVLNDLNLPATMLLRIAIPDELSIIRSEDRSVGKEVVSTGRN